jgi:DNA repair exonuclease SbcCD nuclease subunit
MIICGDLHIRHDIPISRVDDYLSKQGDKLRFLLQQATKSPPLVIAGDFFDKAKPPIELIYWVMDVIDEFNDIDIVVVPGQHDLPHHVLAHINKSGLGLLSKAEYIILLTDPTKPYYSGEYAIWGCPYGVEPLYDPITKEGISFEKNILLWHKMVINKGEELWPGQIAPIAGRFLRTLDMYDFICTGDNHTSFMESSGPIRKLLNTGSLMRMDIGQESHKPMCFKLEDNTVTKIYLPIEDKVLDSSHIVEKKERENRIESFLTKLKALSPNTMGIKEISFENELKAFFEFNDVHKDVKELVWRLVNGE